MTLGVEIRGRADNYSGYGGVPDKDNSFYLHRLRLNGSITFCPWFKFTAQAQDSRVYDYDAPAPYTVANTFDLRQAYFTIGSERVNWVVRVGRQPLLFGDNRLIATSNWGNVGPNYDAVRLSYKYKAMRLDAFSGLVVVPGRGYDRTRFDKKISGIYSSFDVSKGRVLEFYTFWKQNQRVCDERGYFGMANIYTYGVRSTGKLSGKFDYNAEAAAQRGHIARDAMSAAAGHVEVGRRLGPATRPRIWAEYNYSSGDKAARDGHRQTFDQMYPTNVYGTATDFGWRNLHEPAVGLEWQISKSWKIRNAYHGFWLVRRQDAVYTLSGAVYAANPVAESSRVGSEYDTRVICQPSRHVQLWWGYGHLFAGPFLKQTAKSSSVNYPYFMWTFTL
jgi:hypothetical protein